MKYITLFLLSALTLLASEKDLKNGMKQEEVLKCMGYPLIVNGKNPFVVWTYDRGLQLFFSNSILIFWTGK